MEQKPKKRKKQKRLTGKMQAWLWFVFCLFLVGILIVMVRVLIVGNNTEYTKNALKQKTASDTVILYKRGDILDRNGTVLAKSEKIYRMILDARLIFSDREKYEAPTVRALVAVYGYTEGELKAILEERKESAYYCLKSDMNYEEMLAFETYVESLFKKAEDGSVNPDAGKVVGITFEESFRRVYPFETLASHVIGFSNADGEGTYGIEQQYNKELVGTNGRIFDFYDSDLNVQQETRPAKDGNTIVSTVDANLQRIVQKHLENFLDEVGAKNAGVLMMDVNTGEVLAMQSNYGFDLNQPRKLVREPDNGGTPLTEDELVSRYYKQWRNFCINDSYEAGSTFKPFTVAGALEEDLITTSETFLCDGGEQVADYYISCHSQWGHGEINAAQSIMQSCNDALMAIARKEGSSVFSQYQKRFLFGQLTGIDLPGEVSGIVMEEGKINETELATGSFGMGFNTTMIQLGAAFCSLVNGGTYYEPHIVKEIRNSDGVVLRTVEPRAVCSTVSEETSEFLRDAFYMTVEKGTAKAAKVEGYLIGGKTGTAQKLPRSAGKYLVSFIGCIPADKPQVMIYVVIDEADDEELQSRASIASELSAKILEEALPYLKIYPDGEIKYPSFQISPEDVQVPEGAVSEEDSVSAVLPDME